MLRHTSVAHPLLAECVQGLVPPQLVQATISLGTAASRFFSVCSIGEEERDKFSLILVHQKLSHVFVSSFEHKQTLLLSQSCGFMR
jgi:hypothetical protein